MASSEITKITKRQCIRPRVVGFSTKRDRKVGHSFDPCLAPALQRNREALGLNGRFCLGGVTAMLIKKAILLHARWLDACLTRDWHRRCDGLSGCGDLWRATALTKQSGPRQSGKVRSMCGGVGRKEDEKEARTTWKTLAENDATSFLFALMTSTVQQRHVSITFGWARNENVCTCKNISPPPASSRLVAK